MVRVTLELPGKTSQSVGASMHIHLDLNGIDTVNQNLQRLSRPQSHIIGDALYAEGNRIMGESVRLVPVLTGLLRSTAHVERPVQEGPVVTVELSYGSHVSLLLQSFGIHRIGYCHLVGNQHAREDVSWQSRNTRTTRRCDHFFGRQTQELLAD